MSLNLMGKKKGMTRLFDEKGDLIVCTVIQAEPNVVVQVKTMEKDKYSAVQLGAFKVSAPKVKNVSKPLRGHFAKNKIEPRAFLVESSAKEGEYQAGQEINVTYFTNGEFVDVIGVSKGKGFQGVIKRHHFSGGPASHGSGFHRSHGSTGMRTSPGRVLPGMKMAGHMGNERVTVEKLKVVKVDLENNVLFVKGAIPGARGGLVYIRKSMKKRQYQ